MIDYEEDWLCTLLARSAGSVFCRACYFAIPAVIIAVALFVFDEFFPGVRADIYLSNLDGSVIWSATSASLVFMIGFRTNKAIARFWEGTGLLHQMRGEWFDTVSNCVTFSIKSNRTNPEKVMMFRHCLVRLMSLCHGQALEEISGNQFELDTIDVCGLDDDTLVYLAECQGQYNFNKVELCIHLIQSLITQAFHDGILDIPPPILSRVFQTISRGFVNLLNTKKITDTKFPFPFAQLNALLLLVLAVMTPTLVSSFVKNYALAVIITFLPVFGLASLNYISIELENPFGGDENDLPLIHFQDEMDNCLMMLLHPNADKISGLSDGCIKDFEQLVHSTRESKAVMSTATLEENMRRPSIRTSNPEHFDAEGKPRFPTWRSSRVPSQRSGQSSNVEEQDVYDESDVFQENTLDTGDESPIVMPNVSTHSKRDINDHADLYYAEEAEDEEYDEWMDQSVLGLQLFMRSLDSLAKSLEKHVTELHTSFSTVLTSVEEVSRRSLRRTTRLTTKSRGFRKGVSTITTTTLAENVDPDIYEAIGIPRDAIRASGIRQQAAFRDAARGISTPQAASTDA